MAGRWCGSTCAARPSAPELPLTPDVRGVLDATKAPHHVTAVRGFLLSAHLAHGDMQVPADPSSYWLVGLHDNFGNGIRGLPGGRLVTDSYVWR